MRCYATEKNSAHWCLCSAVPPSPLLFVADSANWIEVGLGSIGLTFWRVE
jgi:hypothetical protein